MKFFLLFYLFVLYLDFSEMFFLFPEKHAIFMCLKVCPLYCSRRQKRDAGVYWDDSDEIYEWPPTFPDDDEHPYYSHHPHHVGRWVYCKPSSTTKKPTTTKKPSTTTEAPTWICEVCQKKCGAPKS